ncbi:MAG: GGDEF domain-containing protein [Phycisphaerae bacterium]|nr:GGDEF domain-containing protein [Phycisphaerae bacterium]
MISHANRRELSVRLLAAAITVVSLGALHSLSTNAVRPPETTVFALVFAVCGAFMLIARGLGRGVATGLGVVIALSISIALSNLTGAGAAGNTVFMLVAISLMVFVGRIAGVNDHVDGQPFAAGRNKSGASQVADSRPDSIEQTLGTLASDFCIWTTTDMVRGGGTAPPWPGFARFVRRLLAERLDAADVEVYEVVPGQPRLRPLAANEAQVEHPPLADTGVLGGAIRSNEIHVDSEDSTETANVGGINRIPRQRWAWVLPLRVADQSVGVVTVGRIGLECNRRLGVAHAVRDLLQLFWAHVAGLQALGQARCTDTQTGLLTRAALLDALRDNALADVYRDEPVAVLAVSLEGLRRLDDRSQWSERDELIRRVGDTLCRRLHSDDLVARFADDRFVAVMRRTDAVLGEVAGCRLLDFLQGEVLDRIDPGTTLGVKLRGGMAGGNPERVAPELLLSQALLAIDDARVAGHRFAVAGASERVGPVGAPNAGHCGLAQR